MTPDTSNDMLTAERKQFVRTAIQIELLSLVWIALEASLGMVAAIASGALSVSTFSVDSAIELISGIVVLIRFMAEVSLQGQIPARLERIASIFVGGCLLALAAWVSLRAGQAAALRQAPQLNWLALVVAFGSSVVTPWLAVQKRKLGVLLHSSALIGDAACSMTCALMAWTLLAGLLLEQLHIGWWVDPLAAVLIAGFVIREGFDSLSMLWGGTHVHAHGHH